MINSKNVVAALRRDVAFVWHAVIAVVFIGFASLAVAAALLDVLGDPALDRFRRILVLLPVEIFHDSLRAPV